MDLATETNPKNASSRLLSTAGHTVLSGLAGLIVWELFARLVAPAWLGFALDPTALINMVFGLPDVAARALHLATGLMLYPAGYVIVAHVIRARAPSGIPWVVLGVCYGCALWVFAMYGIASLLGGMPPFMGFEPVAWASLVGHIGLGLGIAGTDAVFTKRQTR